MIRRKDEDSSDQYCNFHCWQYCIQSFELSWRGKYLEVCAYWWTIFRHAIWWRSDVIHVQQKCLTSVKFRYILPPKLCCPFCPNFRQFKWRLLVCLRSQQTTITALSSLLQYESMWRQEWSYHTATCTQITNIEGSRDHRKKYCLYTN
jgi:hypothetical protein